MVMSTGCSLSDHLLQSSFPRTIRYGCLIRLAFEGGGNDSVSPSWRVRGSLCQVVKMLLPSLAPLALNAVSSASKEYQRNAPPGMAVSSERVLDGS